MIDLKDLVDHLRNQGLGDVSEEVAKIVMDLMLTWKDEDSGNPDEAKSIIAFSFGFQFHLNGNRKPGPINEQLADKVEKYYNQWHRPVYAQWEIAKELAGQVSENDLHPIYPKIGRMTGDIEYLSTVGVLEAAIAKGLKPEDPDLSPVLVIAHRYHLLRCVRLVREHGFTVVTAPDDMPFECDPKSGQLWTADRITYIVSDIRSRLSAYRENVLYPRIALGD